jgi:hypothetical protein
MTKWQKGMTSPNTGGRPPGIPDRRSKVARAFEGVGEEIAQVVVDKARGGDMQAANIVLQRLAPPLKARGERVQFSLDASQPMSAQSAAVIQGLADGLLSPDEAQTVLQCLSAHVTLVQADTLEARLAALERAAHAQQRALGAHGGVLYVDHPPGAPQ